MQPVSYDPRFLEGVEAFNRQAFFDAHEIWEAVWMDERGSGRDFYKGLIQVAVCLLHFGRGNTRGARKLYVSSRRYLNAYRPRYGGVDLNRLLGDLDACCRQLADSKDETPQAVLDERQLPTIQLEPPASDSHLDTDEPPPS